MGRSCARASAPNYGNSTAKRAARLSGSAGATLGLPPSGGQPRTPPCPATDQVTVKSYDNMTGIETPNGQQFLKALPTLEG
jgi:hypothetical protein